MKGRNKLWRAFWLAMFFLLVGTAGYRIIEGYSFIDALYMAVITITTVGFGEIEPLSEMGRTFTIFFILSGVGCLAYAFSLITEFIFKKNLSLKKSHHYLRQWQSRFRHCKSIEKIRFTICDNRGR